MAKKVNRRDFLQKVGKGSLGVVATASLAGTSLSCSKAAFTPKPNIIFILADDLGYGDLGSYGQRIIQTPNIDRMVAEGLKFTDHYAGSTVCAPSRCSLMTGMHTGHARVRGNYPNGPFGFGAGLELRPEDVTVAELLKEAGYKTGLFGKWGLGMDKTTGRPDLQGFDEWFGYLNQGHAHFYYPEYLWKNGEKIYLEGNKNGGRKQYSHDLITEEAMEFIEKNSAGPFFLYLAYTIPHAELLVPEDSLKEYRGKFEETPYRNNGRGGMGGYASQATPRAAFAAMVSRMDRDVGRILDQLKALGIDDNTLVLFSSDNGPHLEGGADPDFFKSNGQLRGYKRDLYEGGIRVPMIARWPATIKPGTVTHHASAFWDFLPTACDLAGVQAPKNIDGISFLPTLLGKRQKEHEYLYWEFHERKATDQAVRMGDWKAVRHGAKGAIELYDLKHDVAENHNVAGEHPDIVAKAKNILTHARTEHEIWKLI